MFLIKSFNAYLYTGIGLAATHFTMFTPPPSPMSIPIPAEESAPPPSLLLTKQEQDSKNSPSRVISPQSLCTAEASASRIPLDAKKRSGKRTLLFVTLLPTALILSALLHHYIRIPGPVVLDETIPVSFSKREPQLLSDPTLSSSAVLSSSSLPSQSDVPTSVSSLPPIPVSPALPTPFPQPFDASLSDNFTTTGCQAFFTNFTQEPSFRQCRSFAFLLATSSQFLQDQRNATLLSNIIWGTCNTPPTVQTCDSVMSNYLSQLNDLCQKDIAAENPVALQAQIGFQSYTAMRIAACLPDPSTNSFCYVDAAAASPPADIYFYSLPFGTPVPDSTKPSCSPCIKSLLAVFAQYVKPSSAGSGVIQVGTSSGNSTANSLQPTPLPVLSLTYPPAARLAVNQCGGTYASVSVAQPSGAERSWISWATVFLSLVVFTCWAY